MIKPSSPKVLLLNPPGRRNYGRDYYCSKVNKANYVEHPVEKMRERVVNRSKTPPLDSFEINEEMFDKYLKYWEPPIVEEDILLVT